MKVINLFGGPGSGKSTTAAGLFYFMKLQGIKVELVTEYAKELVYDGTLELMLDRQEVIFAEQNQRLHRLRNNVDFAIIDSPLLLSYVYPEMNQQQKGVNEWPALEAFQQLVLAVIDTYDNKNIFLNRTTEFQEYGRDHDLDQSRAIDQAIKATLMRLNMPTNAWPVGEDVVDKILENEIKPLI